MQLVVDFCIFVDLIGCYVEEPSYSDSFPSTFYQLPLTNSSGLVVDECAQLCGDADQPFAAISSYGMAEYTYFNVTLPYHKPLQHSLWIFKGPTLWPPGSVLFGERSGESYLTPTPSVLQDDPRHVTVCLQVL